MASASTWSCVGVIGTLRQTVGSSTNARGICDASVLVVDFPVDRRMCVPFLETAVNTEFDMASHLRPARKHAAENVIQNNVARLIWKRILRAANRGASMFNLDSEREILHSRLCRTEASLQSSIRSRSFEIISDDGPEVHQRSCSTLFIHRQTDPKRCDQTAILKTLNHLRAGHLRQTSVVLSSVRKCPFDQFPSGKANTRV